MNRPMKPVALIKGEGIAEATDASVADYLSLLGDHVPVNLYRQVLDEVERPLLEAIMKHTCGNQSKAADYLGLNRATLRSKLKRHGQI